MARRALVLALMLAGPLLTGCIGGDEARDLDPKQATPGDRLPPEAWKANLTEPIYDEVTSTLHELTAEDGTRLSLSLHLPAGLEDGQAVPTLLQITPYQSFIQPHTSTAATGTDGPSTSWRTYVERGAAYVELDARGTGASQGCLDFGGSLDRADAQVAVDWIRDQGWSNGVVVTDGVSHPGMGSVVAHTGAPTIDGALAHAPVVSYYKDEWYQGAKFENQFNGPAYQAVELSPPVYDDPAAIAAQAAPCTGQTTLDFSRIEGPFTDTWADRDLSRHVDDVQAPLLLTQGFVDVNVHPDHVQAYWEALPEEFPKHMILGWWYHGWPDMDGHPSQDFEDVRHRWLDTTLFSKDNGLDAEPRVLVEDDTGTWHESHGWPIDESRTVTLNATPEATLIEAIADQGSMSYVTDPEAQRGDWGEARVLFETEPLGADKLVNGAPEVELVASSTHEATKWVAYLVELTDDGEMQRISHGYADSHTWGKEGTWQAMEPGETYTWSIELMPTAVVVEEGHRIGLLIASQDSEEESHLRAGTGQGHCWDDHRGGCYSPSGIVPAETTGQAENTVHTGPEGTSVTLAWVDPGITAKPPW